jgi:hypothetical protein
VDNAPGRDLEEAGDRPFSFTTAAASRDVEMLCVRKEKF